MSGSHGPEIGSLGSVEGNRALELMGRRKLIVAKFSSINGWQSFGSSIKQGNLLTQK
ncbi:hypothetical protein O0555_19050 [Brevibacillus laterosporus]|uniref:hypothetical protein n=1 Tax=Brevibacillus laterosporus TaxID=1465 RepID=UPI0015E2280C|nr:hypothetical protein [Brevibacillus laterosporus]MCR8939410.1 hypothetical protein [Brevibacillus laterosporus]MCZ0842050.1 hypothetical protein [Brevibacillus laterosporus]MCZ0847234.1 hypothetical protein [Brevibacillus laterosporus]MED1910332.1 hypothetical protein [Brevibacillus laterosporus]